MPTRCPQRPVRGLRLPSAHAATYFRREDEARTVMQLLLSSSRVMRRGLYGLLTLGIALSLASCGSRQPKPGTVLDEAMQAGRTAASFPAADEDYFHDMDGALP